MRRLLTKRVVFRVVMFVLLGAIVNVAVAWGCALRSTTATATPPLAARLARSCGPFVPGSRIQDEDADFGIVATYSWEDEILTTFAAGWPRPTLSFTVALADQLELRNALRFSEVDPNEPFCARAAPLLPVWPGFAINTVFYAAVLWLLFACPGKIRRFIRARRGRCPACGYPIGTSEVGTECGMPVKKR